MEKEGRTVNWRRAPHSSTVNGEMRSTAEKQSFACTRRQTRNTQLTQESFKKLEKRGGEEEINLLKVKPYLYKIGKLIKMF